MHIKAEKREAGKFTFYTVRLASGEGKEPFLELKDCKLIDGAKGPFVGFPARKDDAGKYWPYMYASDAFQAAIINAMRKADTAEPKRAQAARPPADDDIPF